MPVDLNSLLKGFGNLDPQKQQLIVSVFENEYAAKDESARIALDYMKQAMAVKPGFGDKLLGVASGFSQALKPFQNNPQSGPSVADNMLGQRADERAKQQEYILGMGQIESQRPIDRFGAMKGALGMASDLDTQEYNRGRDALGDIREMSNEAESRRRWNLTEERLNKPKQFAPDRSSNIFDVMTPEQTQQYIQAEIGRKAGSDQTLGGIPTSVRNSIATSTAKSFFDDRKVPVQPSDTAGLDFGEKLMSMANRPTAPVTPQAVDSALGIAGQFYPQGGNQQQGGVVSMAQLPPEIQALAQKYNTGQMTPQEKKTLAQWMEQNGVEEIQ